MSSSSSYIREWSSSSSFDCPNTISTLTATVQNTGIFTESTHLSVDVNGNDRYLITYTSTGGTSDPAHIFWGEDKTGIFTFSSYVKLIINGTDYYTQTFTGPASTACSSNLIGGTLSSGVYFSKICCN